MNLLIISGSCPPEICGVGDYTERLLTAPSARGWQLYHSTDWGLGSFFKHVRAINATGCDVINIQYPTQGYGKSLIPHLLTVWFSWFTRKRFSATVHEQMQMSTTAYLALTIILAAANRVIFTNRFERDFAVRRMPWLRKRSHVIKIFSNIVAPAVKRKVSERSVDVLNFGHIRPCKGIERFIEDMRPFAAEHRVVLVGQIPTGFEEYGAGIMAAASEAGIESMVGLSYAEVSAMLNDTRVVYLPFPDGASERRGSLLAALTNGAVPVSTVGRFTTAELREALIDVAEMSPVQAVADIALLRDKQQAGTRFMTTQMPACWDEVAREYNDFLSK